jgi:type II secretory pathway component PulJ
MSMSPRRGYLLIEVLATIAIAAVILATLTGLLGTLLYAERQGRDHVLYMVTLDRLARQLRRDLHNASAVLEPVDEAAGEKPQLRLAMDTGREVQYRVEEAFLWREERREQEILRREGYRLPPPQLAEFSRVQLPEATGEIVRLEVKLGSLQADRGANKTLRIEAALGTSRE